jgi:DNA-binding transcriptional MerR regulator
MDIQQSSRLLTIGEFGAATQLSPKALRLYDEERLLCPARVDAESGYRYYRGDQIPLGRLIRTLRDMDLPLARIAGIVATNGAHAEALLQACAQESEQRYLRQKHAFQVALALLREGTPSAVPAIGEQTRPALMVALRPFLAERRSFIERFSEELTKNRQAIADAGMTSAGDPLCILVDPLSDEEGRLEAALPVVAPAAIPRGVTLRQLAPANCAVLAAEVAPGALLDLTATLDALFDWLDRRGRRAIEAPTVSFSTTENYRRPIVSWAFEPVTAPIPKR